MEYIATKFLFGFALGFVGLLLPNLRTIKMLEGKYIQVFLLHILASLMLVVFTILVVDKVIPFIIGNTLGGALSISLLAYRKSNKG